MNTKRFYGAVLAMLLSLMTASADDSGKCGDNVNWYFEEATGKLTISGSGEMYDYGWDNDIYENIYMSVSSAPWEKYYRQIISVSVSNGVTSIGDGVFAGCRGLTSVTIPSSVASIGWGVFTGCSGLTSVTIPSSVASIGSEAFSNCSGLTSVTIGSGVISIGGSVFSECSGLTSVTIPNSVTSIGRGAFYGCSGLTSVTIPNNMISIGDGVFAGCSGLTSVTIPNSVTSISDYAFSGCSGLTSVTIPNSVTSIGSKAFYGCGGLTSVTIGNGVTSIGSGAFNDCNKLSSLTINCNGFGTWFKGLSSIKEIILGEGIISIADEAFNGCKSVTSIELPSTVTEIGQRAFANIDKLTDVLCFAKEVPNTTRTAFENSYIDYATLHVPESSIESYKSTGPWSGFKSIVAGVPTYTLTYVVDGVTYKSTRHEEGETIIPEEPLIKEGYTFSGWSEIPQTVPAQNVTVTGSFTVNKYKLTYIVDGNQYKSYEIEYGTAITPEAAPTKDGYIFSGWSEIPKTMPAQDVTVTGTFTVNNTKYTLTYMVDGEVYKSYQLKVGSTIIPESEPTKAGYTFSGWSEIPEEMPAHDVTVTGTFTRIPLGKCATPTIELKGGRIVFSCETEGVEFNYDIKSNVSLNGKGNDILVNPSISVSVYASKDGYDNSDITTKDILLSSTGMNLDANGDGVINAADVVTIVNAIMSEQQ